MIQVAVGIIGRNGSEILLCRRRADLPYPLKWEFPGGKVKAGETTVDCLRRELKEELGIEPEIGRLFHHQNHFYPDSGSYDIFYYLVPSYAGDIDNKVFDSVSWVEIDKLGSFDSLEGNKEVIAKLTAAADFS